MDTCPLTGKPCNHPKTVYVNEKHYCGECASIVLNPVPGAVKTIIDILSIIVEPKMEYIAPESLTCPDCGMTIYELQNASRLGCPKCYEFFKKFLVSILAKIHHSKEHKGKRPKYGSRENRIKVLEEQLKQAIKKEHYELAQEIKLEINRLKIN